MKIQIYNGAMYSQKKYITITALCIATLATVGMENQLLGVIRLLAILALIIVIGRRLSQTELFKHLPGAGLLACLTVAFSYPPVQTLVYFLHKNTTLSMIIPWLILAAAGLFFREKNKSTGQIEKEKNNFDKKTLLMFGAVFFLNSAMLYSLFQSATQDAFPSPWTLQKPWFFILYFLALVFNIFLQKFSRSEILSWVAIFFHYLNTLGVALLTYPLGYGYDPFLHRAAEKIILELGQIDPKTPFYIGQYVIVDLLAKIGPFSVKTADMYLVPTLAIFLIPISAYFLSRHFWKLEKNLSRAGAILFMALPLPVFYVTTPNNLATLLLAVFLLFSPLFLSEKKYWPLMLSLALSSVCVHPLTGIFALAVFTFIFLSHLEKWKKISPAIIIGSAFATPLLFLIYQISKGDTILNPTIILRNWRDFVSLFLSPYYYQKSAPWFYELIYMLEKMFLPAILILALLSWKKSPAKKTWIYLFMPIAVLINALLLSTWIKIPLLDNYEQLQYAERLVEIIPLFLAPLALFAIAKLIAKNNIVPIFLSAICLLSFYLYYPQQNPKVNFPGYNVTAADFTAVEYIQTVAPQKEYFVLSNILTAAASIEKNGFEKYFFTPEGPIFYYSIPTGGPLYQSYLKMLYQGQKREEMRKIAALTGAKIGFFVVNDYWHNSREAVEGAKKTADRYESMAGGKIHVFTYFFE